MIVLFFMKTVIGIIGPLASGKDTASVHLHKFTGFPIHQVSDIIKGLAMQENISMDRDSLISYARHLTEKYGPDYFVRIALSKLPDFSILTGMRQVGQIHYLRNNCNLLLIGVTASSETRFLRMKLRNKSGDPLTFEEFLKIEERDNKSSVQNVEECMKQAAYVIENNGTIEQLYEKLNHLLIKENYKVPNSN